MACRIAFVVALTLFVSSCGSSKSPSSPSPSASVVGNWQISLVDPADTKAIVTQSGSLLQNNDSVSGSLLFNDSACPGVGSVQGSITGNDVLLVVNPTGSQISLTGTVGAASSSACSGSNACMGGTYITLSTGCADGKTVPSTGTWTATSISPLNGNITGNLVSNHGSTYTVTGQVKQGPNSGGSSTPLGGSLTFSSGFCYPAANIAGAISGTSVAMNLVDPDGTQIGQVLATTSLDGTSLSGTYRYLGQGPGGTPGCTADGTGDITMAVAGS